MPPHALENAVSQAPALNFCPGITEGQALNLEMSASFPVFPVARVLTQWPRRAHCLSPPLTQLSKRKRDLVPAAAARSTASQTSAQAARSGLDCGVEHKAGRTAVTRAAVSAVCAQTPLPPAARALPSSASVWIQASQPSETLLAPLLFKWIIKEVGRRHYLY